VLRRGEEDTEKCSEGNGCEDMLPRLRGCESNGDFRDGNDAKHIRDEHRDKRRDEAGDGQEG
jgi:hypothetical protein